MVKPKHIDHAMHVVHKHVERHLSAANIKRKKMVSNLDNEALAALLNDKANCILSSNAMVLLDLYVGDRTIGMNMGHYAAVALPFACASACQLAPWQCRCFDTDSLCLKSYYFS